MRQCKFRVMKDNVRSNAFRVVHLSQIELKVADAFTTITEDGITYKASWIRDSDGKPDEFESNADALRAIQDMCGEVHLDGFTQEGGDIPVEETSMGFKAL